MLRTRRTKPVHEPRESRYGRAQRTSSSTRGGGASGSVFTAPSYGLRGPEPPGRDRRSRVRERDLAAHGRAVQPDHDPGRAVVPAPRDLAAAERDAVGPDGGRDEDLDVARLPAQ